MSDLPKAKDLIRKAEVGLREMMRCALAEERYSDLAEVAPLASTLSDLLRSNQPDAKARVSPTAMTSDSSRQIVHAVSSVAKTRLSSSTEKPARKDDEYPRFERDGDKLVKVGWSKKERNEYEHRVPRHVVVRVAEALKSTSSSGEVFAMDRLMPFKNSDGSEIPSYQAYLVLAWLRMLGAVHERGKDGYAVVDGGLEASRLNDAWNATPCRN